MISTNNNGSGSRYTYTGGIAGSMTGTITRSFTASNLTTNNFNTTISMGRLSGRAGTTLTNGFYQGTQTYSRFNNVTTPTITSGTSRTITQIENNTGLGFDTSIWSFAAGRYPLLINTPKIE